MCNSIIEIDLEVEAAAVNFLQKGSERTDPFGETINVDFAATGEVVSVEFLSFKKLDLTEAELIALNPHANMEAIYAIEFAQRFLLATLSEASLQGKAIEEAS